MRQLFPNLFFRVSATALLAGFLCFSASSINVYAQEQAPIRYVLKQTPPPVPPKSQPPKSLPRVPFSAFRMKPILDPQLEQQAAQKKTKKTPSQAAPEPKQAEAPVAAETIPVPPRLPSRANTEEQVSVEPKPEEILQVPPQATSKGTKKILGQLPIPPRTPTRTEDMSPTDIVKADPQPNVDVDPSGPLTEPSTKPDPAQAELPATMPDLPEVTNVGELPLPPDTPPRMPENETEAQPASQEEETLLGRLLPPASERSASNNDRKRFGKPKHGMPNATENSRPTNELPPEAEDIKVGRLEETDGISPIRIPGVAEEAPSAPDAAKLTEEGVPAEVIVFFKENSADLEVGQMDVLINDVVKPLRERSRLSIEITAYAEGSGDQAENAKRMSLSRALMIREFLIDQRISASRINVASKGSDTDIDPRDRAELYFSK